VLTFDSRSFGGENMTDERYCHICKKYVPTDTEHECQSAESAPHVNKWAVAGYDSMEIDNSIDGKWIALADFERLEKELAETREEIRKLQTKDKK
jgi:hypothetical protein